MLLSNGPCLSMPEAPGDLPSGMACGRTFLRIVILSRTLLGTKPGARLAAQNGHRNGGLPTPFGWDFGPDGRLVANAREQAIIAQIPRLRAQGLSYRGIPARLDGEGIL